MLLFYPLASTVVATGLHLVSHRELVATGGFHAAWEVPHYMYRAAGRMAGRFVNESSSRSHKKREKALKQGTFAIPPPSP